MNEPVNLTTVFASYHAWEVQLAQHILEQADIETHIADENTTQIHWFRALAIGGVKLRVPGKDADKARHLLLDMAKKIMPQNGEPDCDNCTILKKYYAKWHWVYVLTTICTLGIPLFFRRVKQCPECGKSIRIY